MKKMKLLCSAVLFMFAALFISCGTDYEKDSDGLNIEFEKALKIAPKKNQNILLFVTMEGDDPYSETFLNNVVRTEEFKTEVMEKYTVVRFDFSQSSYEKTASKMNATKAENKIAEKYAEIMEYNSGVAGLLNIEYTPSVYILTKNGYYLADTKLSNQLSSTADFVRVINGFSSTVERLNKLFEKADTGTSIDKVKAIDEIFEYTNPKYRILLTDYLEQVPQLDKTNRTGLVGKYVLAAAENKAYKYYAEGNFLQAAKTYADVAAEKVLSPDEVQQSYYYAGYILASAGYNDFDLMLNYFRLSYEAAPESEIAPSIKNSIDYILTIKAASEKAAEEALQNSQNADAGSITLEDAE